VIAVPAEGGMGTTVPGSSVAIGGIGKGPPQAERKKKRINKKVKIERYDFMRFLIKVS